MIRPFGERALLVELDGSESARLLEARLRTEPVPGVLGAIPGRSSVLVELDPAVAEVTAVERAIRERVSGVAGPAASRGRQRVIPVVYGGDEGPDLAEVASLTGLAEDEVVARHAGADLRALFAGFAPGFAYLGDLPVELQIPRIPTPRTRTPAGSVAIAGPMSGVYPAVLPGGWRVIGRTPITLFDPRRDPPAYLVPGDVIRFEPISRDRWDALAGVPGDW
jgi:KipI family sensor histidine kinase inhibitor